MRSDAEGIRRAARSIERGNETLKSWLEATDGQVISMDNSGGRAQMQADHLHELEGLRDRYREIVGTSASIGIGSTVGEAEIAVKAARVRGGDRALIFSPQMENELSDNVEKLKMLDKAEPEDLDKAEGPKSPTISKPQQPMASSGDHSQEEAIQDLLAQADQNAPDSPESTHAAKDFEDYLHEAAQKQDRTDTQQAQEALQQAQGVRKQVAQVLQALREQAPVLEQLKGPAPQLYQAVTGMIQSTIAMAQLLSPQDQPAGQPIQKAEVKKPNPDAPFLLARMDMQRQRLAAQQKAAAAPRCRGCSSTRLQEIAPSRHSHEPAKSAPWVRTYCADPSCIDSHPSVACESCGRLDRSTSLKDLSPVIQKALGDVQPGQEIKPGVFDYSHVLPQQHRDAGYGLLVHHAPKQIAEGPVSALAQLTHGGKVVGGLNATQNQAALRIGESVIKDPKHRGGGKGTAMYEALLSHAKNVGGARYAFGDIHSSSASAAHQRLANKHGLEYVPEANPRTAANPSGDYDKKYLPYKYTLKGELPPNAKLAQGIGMAPAHSSPPPAPAWPAEMSDVQIEKYIGNLHTGSRRDLRSMPWGAKYQLRRVPMDALPPGQPPTKADVKRYATMDPATAPPIVITGRGVPDGHHRIAAARLRGDTHHLAYVDSSLPLGEAAYKTELLPDEDGSTMEKAFGGLPLPHAPKRTNLHLPVGTTIESTGRFKVMTPTGKTKWKQGRVGVIMSKQPETAAADYGHPTSSREPNN